MSNTLNSDRSRVAASVGAFLAAALLGACSAGGDDSEQDSQAPEAEIEQALTPISNSCATVLCPTGTACNPKTGTCDPAPTLISARCTISGDPPVTSGCAEGEQCRPYACTNSIPPTCIGTCAGSAIPSK